jgi:hypothetical protein
MSDLWPWLAIAGLGALHGLSPANGWIFAAACGMQARRALFSIAVGQVASIAVLACTVWLGFPVDRALMRDLAGALLIGAAAWHWLDRRTRLRAHLGTPARHAGLALWTFLAASAQGAGLMLVPALMPMCVGGTAMGAIAVSGSLLAALAAVAVHTAAMLLSTGLLATGASRALARWRFGYAAPAAAR